MTNFVHSTVEKTAKNRHSTIENSKYEIDFIVQNGNDEIVPVEAKSGENLKARSFKLFCEKFQPETAIRTSLSNYHKENWLINVPLYIVGEYFKHTENTNQ